MEPVASSRDRRVLVFRVAGEQLALPASEVAEVIRPPRLTRVPMSPPGLAGVANLRGTVLPVVSLGRVLGTGTGTPAANARVIVVDTGGLVGLAVDEVTSLSAPQESEDSASAGAGAAGSTGSGARLLDLRPMLEQTFGERGRRTGAAPVQTGSAPAPSDRENSDLVALIAFEVAGQDYALPLERVGEIVAVPPDIALVPRADETTLGVASIRGQVMPLLSLRALLGLPSDPTRNGKAKIIVSRIGGSVIGLVADAMKEILRVPPAAIDPVPAVLARGGAEAEIQGICRLDEGRRLVSILSTDRLLRDAARSGYLSGAHQKEETMVPDDTGAEEVVQFVVFGLGGEEYGLPISAIEEVVKLPETLTRLPTAPAFVEGVMNLRGSVIPVIDQRRRFESGSGAATRKERIIVVRIGEMRAGFVVDRVTEVLRVPSHQLRPAPEFASDRSKVIDRIANIEVEGRMILLVDPRELLDRAEKDLLAGLHLPETGQPDP
jgi:purine-binding chemotaxis protein CheW